MIKKHILIAFGPLAALAAAIGITGCGSSTPAAPAVVPAAAQSTGSGPFSAFITSCGIGSDNGTQTPEAVVEVQNVSNSVTGTPDMQVKFLDGTTVLGSNVNELGSVGSLSPGQSETVYVWGLDANGNPLAASGTVACQPDTYWSVSNGTNLGPYDW